MKYLGEFKQIDTEEKAYFLGQAFGDGYNCAEKHYKFSMASINTDIEMYKKLHNLFPFLKLKFYSSHKNMVYLDCHFKDVCKDLQALGLQSNKTIYDKTGEFHFPQLSEEMLPHFIRGFFDADGSAWYPKRYRSRNNLHIEISLSTPNFLYKLKEILDNQGIHFNYYEREKKASNGKYYKSYCLLSSDYNTSIRFADYIYKNATIYLNRKYNLCYRKKVDISDKDYGTCPICGSNNIVQNGTRHTKRGIMQRYKCHNCRKNFQNALLTSNCKVTNS